MTSSSSERADRTAQFLVDNLNRNVREEHKKPKRFQFLSSLKAKHEGYFTVVWYISFGIGIVYGFLRLLAVIFNALRAGDFWTFVFAILLNSILTFIWGLIGGVVVFVVLVVLSFIPYLIVRGFAK
jgi:hypothetical protein